MECPRKLLCRGAFDSVEDAQIYKDEISDFLLGEMDETFNCSLEDGSDQEVVISCEMTCRLPRSF
jgi:singapore isolate B (sub-type 7) whole genome shotgun sequence assembly, scaffold_3